MAQCWAGSSHLLPSLPLLLLLQPWPSPARGPSGAAPGCGGSQTPEPQVPLSFSIAFLQIAYLAWESISATSLGHSHAVPVTPILPAGLLQGKTLLLCVSPALRTHTEHLRSPGVGECPRTPSSSLALSTWKWCQIPEVEGSAPLGCTHPASDANRKFSSINLLQQFTKLRKTISFLDY